MTNFEECTPTFIRLAKLHWSMLWRGFLIIFAFAPIVVLLFFFFPLMVIIDIWLLRFVVNQNYKKVRLRLIKFENNNQSR
jgi:hypothetical protein